jgi:hypothetical protein
MVLVNIFTLLNSVFTLHFLRDFRIMTFRTKLFLQTGRLNSNDVVFEYEVCCTRKCNLYNNTREGEETKFAVPVFVTE